MRKVLIITTVSGFVPQFEMNNVRILQESGYEVHYASNFKNPHYGKDNSRLDGTGIISHQVDFVRSPFRIYKNIKAYRQLKEIMKTTDFNLVHCHTPMGGVLGRMAARMYRKKGTKVLYTAHGFHFYKGAPLINWLCYYLVEWLLSRYTDILITINDEDYQRAKKFPVSKGGKVEKVNGVGIDIEAYRNIQVDREAKRRELNVRDTDYLLVSAGELTKRKNHQIIIRTLASMKEECKEKKIRYVICGEGPERKHLERLIAKEELEEIVLLLGYRTDIKEILAVSDCFIFPSRQEGLPVALMEAMAVGLPCICSDVRGNRDLKEKNDRCFLADTEQEYAMYIKKLKNNANERSDIRNMEIYDISYIDKSMKLIYLEAEKI